MQTIPKGDPMTRLTFYFDPLCPWAWLTSLWAREVSRERDLEIDWKFFSLATINELDADRNGALRICAQARREGGNDAVERAYLALGRMIHERRQRYETLDELRAIAPAALEEVGLDPKMVDRALSDESTLQEVRDEHAYAVEHYDAFGVPWLVLEDGTKGFFGPVIGERLYGNDAAELWDHFVYISGKPSLFELKRGRVRLPQLGGLSDDLLQTPATAGK
jgi:predicted DsbA family dithiol-disulfide isomerase